MHRLQDSDRRLLLAAFDLALKYGYESPEAFTRALKKCTELLRQTHESPASGAKLIRECPFNFLMDLFGRSTLIGNIGEHLINKSRNFGKPVLPTAPSTASAQHRGNGMYEMEIWIPIAPKTNKN